MCKITHRRWHGGSNSCHIPNLSRSDQGPTMQDTANCRDKVQGWNLKGHNALLIVASRKKQLIGVSRKKKAPKLNVTLTLCIPRLGKFCAKFVETHELIAFYPSPHHVRGHRVYWTCGRFTWQVLTEINQKGFSVPSGLRQRKFFPPWPYVQHWSDSWCRRSAS